MYKVVLIDDEIWVLKALRTLIDWEALGFRVVGEFDTAAGIDLQLKRLSPDLIISDIRMPGTSGLDLLRSLNRDNSLGSTLTVFISAYSDFNYAQEAITLGAFDYILKPVETLRLEETVKRAAKRLDEMKETKRKLSGMQNTAFLYELVESGGQHSKCLKKLVDYGFRPAGSLYAVAVVKDLKQSSADERKLAFGAINGVLEQVFGNAAFLSAAMGVNKWVCLISFNKYGRTAFQLMLRRMIAGAAGYGAVVGLSRAFGELDALKSAFTQAENACERRLLSGRAGIALYREPDYRLLNVFYERIKRAPDTEQLKLLVSGIPQMARKSGSNAQCLEKIFLKVFERSCELKRTAVFTDSDVLFAFPDELTGLDAAVDYLLHYLEEDPDKGVKGGANAIIGKITGEMKEHYSQKLLINSFAQKYNMNPSYLSDLFKKETGRSFTSYLLEIRLDKAAELLSGTELSIYEICEKVGYDDYFHFNKLFMKYRQITPSAYRKRCGAREY